MTITLLVLSMGLIAVGWCGRLEPQYLPPRQSGGGGSGSGSPSGNFGSSSGNNGLGGFGSGAASHSSGNGGHGSGFGASSSGGNNGGGSGSGNQIPITKFENTNNGDGTYSFSYEAGNGISAHESGKPSAQGPEGPAVTAEGGFSFRTPDGQQIELTYTADENGFHPVGPHLPTPPPIPEEILRSIEFNKQNPSSGEGSYNGGGGSGTNGSGSGGTGTGTGSGGGGYRY